MLQLLIFAYQRHRGSGGDQVSRVEPDMPLIALMATIILAGLLALSGLQQYAVLFLAGALLVMALEMYVS